MANSGDFYTVISGEPNHPTLIALIQNLKGAENAHAHGVEQVNFVFSASDTHNLQNAHKSTDESLNELETIQEFCKQR
jgi:hydroxymethylglutaryl-CoA lyase